MTVSLIRIGGYERKAGFRSRVAWRKGHAGVGGQGGRRKNDIMNRYVKAIVQKGGKYWAKKTEVSDGRHRSDCYVRRERCIRKQKVTGGGGTGGGGGWRLNVGSGPQHKLIAV